MSLGVRLFFGKAPTLPQLKAVRAAFPELASIAPARLRDRLSERPVCVVGLVQPSESAAVEARLTAAGIGVELFDDEDYAAPYIRSLMPPAPESWGSAPQTLELLFRPSLSPEVILRLWNGGDVARLQLGSLGTSVWASRFGEPPWLTATTGRVATEKRTEPEPPREQPHSEVAQIESIDQLMATALGLGAPSETYGLDGMIVDIRASSGADRVERELWSPTPTTDPAGHELLRRALILAKSCLRDMESRERLEELQRTI